MGRLVSTSSLRREVDAAVRAGKSLEEIDNEILAPCALNEDARSALWLYAWGAVGRAQTGEDALLGGRADVVDAPLAP
jgi:hypothetical protein